MKTMKTTFAAAVVVLVALPLLGQTLTGSIGGVVKDEQGAAAPGATVTLTGKTGSVTATTDAKGAYRFPTVDPGVYQVKADLAQFQSRVREGVSISIGLQLNIDFVLKLGLHESVDVVGEAPVVDVTSSAASEGLSQDVLFNMPLSRFAPGLLNYTPGVNDDSAFGGGDAANGFYLDGVSTRSPGGGSDYVFLNYNIIEEFQVEGLGAPAEYGSFTGAVINYISKSGGNQFAGLFDAQYTNDHLASNNVSPQFAAENPSLGQPEKTTKLLDVTAQLSGPLIKDKLFFFLSAQRYQFTADPPGPRTERNETTPRLNAKLTYQPTQSDTLTAAFQGEDYNRTGVVNGFAGSLATTEATSLLEDGPDRLWTLQWRHLFGSKTFLEAKYAGYTAKDYLDPKVSAPLHYDVATGAYSGGGGYTEYADRKKQTLQAAVSHYADAFGHHNLKFGAEIERSRTRDRYAYVGGRYYYDYGGAPYYSYSYSYDITGDNHRESLYAQDSWKIGDRLTINPGLRYDNLRGVRPDTGEAVYKTSSLAPRLGLAFDLTGDHKTALRAFYGQYYEDLLQYQYYRMLPGTSDRITYDATGAVYAVDPLSNSAYHMDPNIKHPKVEEFLLAFERALASDVRFSVTGVLRNNHNFIGSVIPSAQWTPTTVTNGLNGQPLTVYNWANKDESSGDLLITNPNGFVFKDANGNPLGTTDASARYRSLILSLERQLSKRWQAKVSYVLSSNKGTVDPFSAEHIGYGRQFETPTLALVNTYGSFRGSRPHELKAFFTYEVPKVEVNLNAYYRLMSGGTYTAYQRYPSSQINFTASSLGREPWLEPLGSRSLDTTNLMDLRIEKTFKVHAGRIGVYADLFNLFNASQVDDVQNRVPSINVDGNSVAFGSPASIVSPRQVTFGARWSF